MIFDLKNPRELFTIEVVSNYEIYEDEVKLYISDETEAWLKDGDFIDFNIITGILKIRDNDLRKIDLKHPIKW